MAHDHELRSLHKMVILLWGMCFLTGCPQPVESVLEDSTTEGNTDTENVSENVSVLVVNDDPLAAAIENQWNTRAIGTVTVETTTAEQVGAQIRAGKLTTDLIVYPSYLLGELVEHGAIVPVPDHVQQDSRFGLADLVPMLRLHEAKWGSKLFASSFGSPSLVVYYRSDLLEASQLDVPTSWEDYEEVAASLATGDLLRPNVSDQTTVESKVYAIAEPLAPGWAGQMLLARAAAYVKHRNNYSAFFHYRTMEPLIDSPPFVRALEELAAAARLAPPDILQMTPADVRALFEKGGCALAITWPSHSPHADVDEAAGPLVIGFAELPGSADVYHIQDKQWQQRADGEEPQVPLLGVAGRLISITSVSRRSRSAAGALSWLTSEELGPTISPHSQYTGICRMTQLSQTGDWFPGWVSPAATRQYSDVIATSQTREAWLCSVRIPGRDRYMAALDRAVHQTVQGESSATKALQTAAREWHETTTELGIEQQSAAYRHSIGLD